MTPMPLRAVSFLLHLYVGWRLIPGLGSAAAGIALAVVLIVSALALPYGLAARSAGGRRFAAPLAWLGLLCMGLFSSLFVLTLGRDVVLLLVALASWPWPDAVPWPSLESTTARLVPMLAAAMTLWGFVNARRTAGVRRVDVAVDGLPAALEGSRSPRSATSMSARRSGGRMSRPSSRRSTGSAPTWSPSPATSSTARWPTSPAMSRRWPT